MSFFDVGLAMTAARAGQGVIIARRSLAGAYLEEGSLVAPFGVRAAPDSHYYLCREASTPLTGAHLAFSLWVKALCARISKPS